MVGLVYGSSNVVVRCVDYKLIDNQRNISVNDSVARDTDRLSIDWTNDNDVAVLRDEVFDICNLSLGIAFGAGED
ncbi:hypothetical protein SDC9_90616 [bioreactor metagenome]|uniref:Uncharacterized protein n=1 Tax=bioreactor metagenome TaxID=1076179 RepID=A0A644ZU53_9ZZZZ